MASSRAWLYFRRACALRCPECGVSPVFLPWRQVRRVGDWLHPLPGCPRCGYAYEREPGYFLAAIWAINFGVVGGLGIIGSLLAQRFLDLPVPWLLLLVAGPLPFLSLLFARHAKSLFLALDHHFDPHRPG